MYEFCPFHLRRDELIISAATLSVSASIDIDGEAIDVAVVVGWSLVDDDADMMAAIWAS